MLVAQAHECWKLSSKMLVECEREMMVSHIHNTRSRLSTYSAKPSQIESADDGNAEPSDESDEPPNLLRRTSDYFTAIMLMRALLSEGFPIATRVAC